MTILFRSAVFELKLFRSVVLEATLKNKCPFTIIDFFVIIKWKGLRFSVDVEHTVQCYDGLGVALEI